MHLPPELSRPSRGRQVVRWGGEQTQFNVEQWGTCSSSVSDEYVEAVLDGTLYERLGTEYEVYTVFVESGADLRRLHAPAVVPLLRGRHFGALYFLWPVHAQVRAALSDDDSRRWA